MPAKTRAASPAPLWPRARPLAVLFLLVPFAARAHDGPHLHPHGTEYLWQALAAALLVGAGWAIGRWRR